MRCTLLKVNPQVGKAGGEREARSTDRTVSARTPARCEDDRMERVRIDRWLWAARFFKTRSAATDAVAGGHVQVGGERVKPAKEVKVGDTLEIRRGEVRWTVVVTGVADRRGSASVAAGLYEETIRVARGARAGAGGTQARPAARRRPRRATDEAGAPRLEALRRGERHRPTK